MKTSIAEVSAMLSVLSPEIAALVMSGSSALLAINAPMLKRTKLAGIRRPGAAVATVAAQVPA